jgi:GTP-binding nuclear protein Ran
MYTFKILLVGQPGCGKTTFIHRLANGNFITNYEPTDGPKVSQLKWFTNYGWVNFTITELNDLSDGCHESDGAIVMFDMDRDSNQGCPEKRIEVVKCYADLINFPAKVPIVVVGHKCDLKKTLFTLRQRPIPQYLYYPVSSKSCYNLEKPLLSLTRELIHSDLVLVEEPAEGRT